MESLEEHEHERKQRRLSGCARDGVDLTSGLDDDVLLHILRRLPSATDVARAGALSRRWLDLSTHAHRLHFDLGLRPGALPKDAPRFMAFVNAVLARRHAVADAERLLISFRRDSPEVVLPLPGITPAIIDRWLSCGLLRTFRSFSLYLPKAQFAGMGGLMVLGDLPDRSRLENMRLSLGMAILKLPKTVSFQGLVNLSLSFIEFSTGTGDYLGRVLSSSCCPRLRKLHLRRLYSFKNLELQAGALEELRMKQVYHLRQLKIETPALRVLNIDDCFVLPDIVTTATILAPRLEKLACCGIKNLGQLEFDGWSSVRCLENVNLNSHPIVSTEDNVFSISLLQRCISVNQLKVSLEIPTDLVRIVGEQEILLEHLMGEIPQLPHVTNLTVYCNSWYGGHMYGASVVRLVARCHMLEYLHLDILGEAYWAPCEYLECPCCHPTNWKDQKISLACLQEVEINGFKGLECEINFLQLLLANAPTLLRMKVTLHNDHEEGMMKNCKELILHMPGARGNWVDCPEALPPRVTFKWTPN